MAAMHIGTMGWSYNFWIGKFYPEGSPSKNLLAEYAKKFDTVEIDSTFYRIPYRKTVENWKLQTPEGFMFSAKFPRVITHVKSLENCEDELAVFLDHLSLLGDKLGPMLLQFPPGFKPEKFDVLKDFLHRLPEGYRYAVEVRSKKWLDQKFFTLLRDHRIAFVLIDHPWMPEMDTITADFTYLRWEGDRKTIQGTLGTVEKDRSRDITRSAGKIRGFLEENVEVFGYFSKTYSGFPPGDVQMLMDLLGT